MKKGIIDFKKMKRKNEKLAWITAYDYPFSYCAEQSGIDMILVGDSGGMVQLGYETTNPVTMDEMLILARSVHRGAPNTFIIGDMPQGSYEVSDQLAVTNALKFIKESSCDAIKCEGGRRIIDKVKAIINAGIPVCGHLGLTPQSTSSFGGYRVQGKSLRSFESILNDAFALQDAGVFALLLEAMPEESAAQIASKLKIPVYGIGAGRELDGQLLIMHDLLGLYYPFRPKFAKCYIPDVAHEFTSYLNSQDDLHTLGSESRLDGLLVFIQLAIKRYISAEKNNIFPDESYIYKISESSLSKLKKSSKWL